MKKRWPTGGTPALNWWRLPALDMHKGGGFFVSKVTAELRRADAEACVLCSEGMEGGGGGAADTLPPLLAGRDTDVREQKFPREKRADSAHFSALHHETHFVRARVFNWLRILTSLHAFFFLPSIPGHVLRAP